MFRLDWEWLEPPSRSVESHARTWARLEIQLDTGVYATHVEDLRLRSTRNGIFIPLMPVAEWMVSNWRFIFEESPPTSLDDRSLSSRGLRPWLECHNLHWAREGFPLPDLTFARDDEQTMQVLLRPDPGIVSAAPIRFTEAASVRVTRDEVMVELRRLLDAVAERLEGCHDPDAADFLHFRGRLFVSPEDVVARRAAAMGIDIDAPGVSRSTLEALLVDRLSAHPVELLPDLFEAASSLPDLEACAAAVERARLASESSSPTGGLAQARARVEAISGYEHQRAHAAGYELARRFRRDVLAVDAATVAEALDRRIDEVELLRTQVEPNQPFLAWVDAKSPGIAGCRVSDRATPTSLRFLRARALAAGLLGVRERLVVNSGTRPQRLGRAFAAELLAPASILRDRLSGDFIGSAELDRLSNELRVDRRVVRYQIENHDLGVVEDAAA